MSSVYGTGIANQHHRTGRCLEEGVWGIMKHERESMYRLSWGQIGDICGAFLAQALAHEKPGHLRFSHSRPTPYFDSHLPIRSVAGEITPQKSVFFGENGQKMEK